MRHQLFPNELTLQISAVSRFHGCTLSQHGELREVMKQNDCGKFGKRFGDWRLRLLQFSPPIITSKNRFSVATQSLRGSFQHEHLII